VDLLRRLAILIAHAPLAYARALARLRALAPAPHPLIVDLQAPADPLDLPGTRHLRSQGPRQWLELTGAPAPAIAAAAAHHPIADLTLHEPGIEDVLARLYRGRS